MISPAEQAPLLPGIDEYAVAGIGDSIIRGLRIEPLHSTRTLLNRKNPAPQLMGRASRATEAGRKCSAGRTAIGTPATRGYVSLIWPRHPGADSS